MNTTTNRTTAEALEREWLALGFTEGAAASIPATIVQADVRIYRSMKCATCNHRGHKVKAYHRAAAYRLLCACRHCGSGMEA